jgi:hypothetical protein
MIMIMIIVVIIIIIIIIIMSDITYGTGTVHKTNILSQFYKWHGLVRSVSLSINNSRSKNLFKPI